MGWDNPPVPWREFERRLSWRQGESKGQGEDEGRDDQAVVTRLPVAGQDSAGSGTRGRRVATAKAIPWAELHCHSAYSFLDGASTPGELIAEAAECGLTAVAITDHDGMYGVPQFAQSAARFLASEEGAGSNVATVFGAELSLDIPALVTPAIVAARRAGTGPASGWRAGAHYDAGPLPNEQKPARPGEPPGAQGEPPPGARPSRRLVSVGLTVAEAERAQRWPLGTPRAGVPDPAGRHLLVLARDPEGYARLCRVISAAHLAGGEKGRPVYDLAELASAHDGHWVILTGCRKGTVPSALVKELSGTSDHSMDATRAELRALTEMFGRDNVMVELISNDQPGDDERNDALFELARQERLGVVASNNVHHAGPADAKLAQVLAAIRARSSLEDMDGWLAASGTAYIRTGEEMAYRLRRYPGVLERTVDLAMQCAFDFEVIAPKLPDFPVPPGHSEMSWLRALVERKAPERYGRPDAERIPGAYLQIKHELDVIDHLGFAGYFLIVNDIVEFCDKKRILCQGRGSAANSAVCYALGITSVDPVQHGLLFERFLSTGRDGPPDIDLDIEHQRREDVIQYVYGAYGRGKAAQVANVIAYRPRMAIRDAGRALGYSPEQQNAWSKQVGPRSYAAGQPVPPDAGVPEPVIALAERMQKLPRHLGIHSGGMVICDRPVGEVCPVEWAQMPNRSVLQWDKDDCAYAGLVKFDLLGLGMLTALRDCFELVAEHHGVRWDLHSIPQEDAGVYDMLCEADTVGVFQVESRAQMATLPRLRPREFYDLVVEVALIRPGPIQGGSVHPYMRRRRGDEVPYLPHPSMQQALGKTLGVPLFQEQMMQIAIDCAGFSPAEADRLRQAMSSKRAPERIEELRARLLSGMAERGITLDVAEDIYEKILAFSSYGFPESHAISFAYLVYASAWLKCYYPAAFTAALLRAQPMGFYSPASLISDVRRHGVEIRGVDVNASGVLATLESHSGVNGTHQPADPVRPVPSGGKPVPHQPAIRVGLSEVRNLGKDAAAAIVAGQPYADLEDFARRTIVSPPALEALATAGAFCCFGLERREALWAAGAAATISAGHLPGTAMGMAAPALTPMTPAEVTFADMWATGTYGATHPIEHIRDGLAERGVTPAADQRDARNGAAVTVGGLVTHRQQPGTARGVVFLSLEDETGMANIICPPDVWQRHRKIGVDASALLISGRVERLDGAVSLLATSLRKLRVVAAARSRDFR
ncbi:MAG TPA: error-prone DNA polymerase [Streptosporangiaceae bacterium]|nr:error-prone DNA polymerase [Streptosporangiaceae bacterium]